jgi:hypothetical protein
MAGSAVLLKKLLAFRDLTRFGGNIRSKFLFFGAAGYENYPNK